MNRSGGLHSSQARVSIANCPMRLWPLKGTTTLCTVVFISIVLFLVLISSTTSYADEQASALTEGSARQQSLFKRRGELLVSMREELSRMEQRGIEREATIVTMRRELQQLTSSLSTTRGDLAKERQQSTKLADGRDLLQMKLHAAQEEIRKLESTRLALLKSLEQTREQVGVHESRSALPGAGTAPETMDSLSEPRASVSAISNATANAQVSEKASTQSASTASDVQASESLALTTGWIVEFNDTGPLNYLSMDEVKSFESLPPASRCSEFAVGLSGTQSVRDKLVVNDFPVTAFWVLQEQGRLGICRATESASGWTARLTRLSVMPGEKAIAPIKRTDKE